MKKFIFGLSVALAAFFCGIAAAKIFGFKQELIFIAVVEEVKAIEPVVFTPKPYETKEEIQMADVDDIIGGWYHLDSFEVMNEVDIIELNTYWRGENNERIVSTAAVYTKNKILKSVWAEIDNKKVSFRTEKIKGVEYRFKGTFFKNKTSGKDGEEILRGSLQKFVKGKKAAELKGDFAYYVPSCGQ